MTELLFSLSMPPDAHYLGALRAFFKPILERHCESDSEKLLLALGEAVSNVIQHRCSSLADEQIRVAASLADDLVRFELGGFCRTDDLPRIHGRDLEDVRPGGLGTHFIDQIMDLVDYEPEADRPSCMSLILEKRITQNAGKDPTRDH